MKTLLSASILALGLFATSAQAAEKDIFTDINQTAPLAGTFDDLNQTAPRSPYASLNDTAPRSGGLYEDLQDTAPHAPGTSGRLSDTAPLK